LNATVIDLLRAMRSNPKDLALRLIYADELDELGHADAATFVRRHCEIYPLHVSHSDRKSETVKPDLEAAMAAGQVFPADEIELHQHHLDLFIGKYPPDFLRICRGLADRFYGTLDRWVRGMEAHLRWHPIRWAQIEYHSAQDSLIIVGANGSDGPAQLTVAVPGTEPLGPVPVPAGNSGLNWALTQLVAVRWPAIRFKVIELPYWHFERH
jgi:uncharacterized protein (TIGR02996 family)